DRARPSPIRASKSPRTRTRSPAIEHPGYQSVARGTIARPVVVFHGRFRATVTLPSRRPRKLAEPGFVIRVSLIALAHRSRMARMSSNLRREANGIVPEKTYGERYRTEYAPLLDGSAAMRAIREMVESIAETDATVLLRGESGVGKDLVARAIHAASKRCHDAFVKVNCAAIPPGLLESELFGHEKGAFTAAHRRTPGQFEYLA